MQELVSVHVKLPYKTINEIDLLIQLNPSHEYTNRSQFIRAAINEKIKQYAKEIIPLTREKNVTNQKIE